MKRSEDVAVRPGYWQFIPSGGFELFENNTNSLNIRKNFDAKLAIFRELLEEIFGQEDFEHNKNGDIEL